MFGNQVSQKARLVDQPLLQNFTVYVPDDTELGGRETKCKIDIAQGFTIEHDPGRPTSI